METMRYFRWSITSSTNTSKVAMCMGNRKALNRDNAVDAFIDRFEKLVMFSNFWLVHSVLTEKQE